LQEYLAASLKYPRAARWAKVTRTVFVSFVVGGDGHIRDAQILQGLGYGCDEEATRVIILMSPWMSGRQQGEPVAVRYTIPIRFSL
jgi:protein TonB